MGGLKFEKPIEIPETPKEPLTIVEEPQFTSYHKALNEGAHIIPASVPEETMTITPELGHNPGVRYSANLAMVRVSSDVPLYLQKYQTDLATQVNNLEGITQSLVVYSDPVGGALSGARKGLAGFLGSELLLKLFSGEFLTGPYAWVSLAYFLILGGCLGWFADHFKKPTTPALPEAKVVEPQKRLKP